MEQEFFKAQEDGVIPKYEDGTSLGGSWSSLSDEGEATNLNLVHMDGVDALSVDEITEAEMRGRKATMSALRALRHTVPGFEDAKLRNYSMTLGVRDTRKIVGRYNLTRKDVLEEGRFA